MCNSEKIEQKAEGISSLEKLSDEGNNLAKVNLMLIQKTKDNSAIKNEIPEWIIAISKTKLSENIQNAISLLDSTFSKDKYKLLSCKQVSGEPIYRKWKSTKEKSTIVLQYIFNDSSIICMDLCMCGGVYTNTHTHTLWQDITGKLNK